MGLCFEKDCEQNILLVCFFVYIFTRAQAVNASI